MEVTKMKRPTRAEAIKAFRDAWRAVEVEDGRMREAAGVDAVAALFGGFKPEPVQVPTIRVLPCLADFNAAHLKTEAGFFGAALMLAVAARSNAWPRLHALLLEAKERMDGGASNKGSDLVRDALALMASPEMGTGPEERG
jgi:hypothetical protein